MDTSKENILMCEKAWADIGVPNYEPTLGHYVKGESYRIDEYGQYWYRSEFLNRVPLYRQDQLQEMLVDHINRTVFDGSGNDRNIRVAIYYNLCAFTDQIYEESEYPIYPTNIFNTQEQLWLAFAMKEKFNKTWNGEDWGGIK